MPDDRHGLGGACVSARETDPHLPSPRLRRDRLRRNPIHLRVQCTNERRIPDRAARTNHEQREPMRSVQIVPRGHIETLRGQSPHQAGLQQSPNIERIPPNHLGVEGRREGRKKRLPVLPDLAPHPGWRQPLGEPIDLPRLEVDGKMLRHEAGARAKEVEVHRLHSG